VGDGGPAFAVTPHEDEGLVLRYHNFAPASTIHAWSLEIIVIIIRIKGEINKDSELHANVARHVGMHACAGLSGGER
jgi:hypothetical protein